MWYFTFLLLTLFWSGSVPPIKPNLFRDSALLLLSIDRDLDLADNLLYCCWFWCRLLSTCCCSFLVLSALCRPRSSSPRTSTPSTSQTAKTPEINASGCQWIETWVFGRQPIYKKYFVNPTNILVDKQLPPLPRKLADGNDDRQHLVIMMFVVMMFAAFNVVL